MKREDYAYTQSTYKREQTKCNGMSILIAFYSNMHYISSYLIFSIRY